MTTPPTPYLIEGDIRAVADTESPLPHNHFQCIVTSPPYWKCRDYGHGSDQLGQEESPIDFVWNLVNRLDALRPFLRDDGSLWLNIGDVYAKRKLDHHWKAGDLIGIPAMIEAEMLGEGWHLRSRIIWHKPNPTPAGAAGLSRPGNSYEFILLFTKQRKFYYDPYAVMVPAKTDSSAALRKAEKGIAGQKHQLLNGAEAGEKSFTNLNPGTCLKDVWTIPTRGYKGSHFAVFPPELARRCILASTSAYGACGKCFAPYRRIIKRERIPTRPGATTKIEGHTPEEVGNRDPERHVTMTRTVAWRPTCDCDAKSTAPCQVLDPFVGSGTTILAGLQEGRQVWGVDISLDAAKERLAAENITLPL